MWGLALAVAIGNLSLEAPPMVGFFNSSHLAETCRASGASGSAKHSVCLGYIAGSIDQLLMDQALKDGNRTICPPPGVTLNAATMAVLGRMGVAQGAGKVGAAGFVKFALEDAYPCKPDGDIM